MREGRGRPRYGAVAASGALAVPLMLMSPAAEAVPGVRPSGVRLLMDITATGDAARGPGYTLTYTVRVRARGGVARHAAVRLVAERPLVWTSHSRTCSKADSGRELRCELGDVGAKPQERKGTVRIPASKVSGPAAKPLSILALADASNATRRSALAMFDFSGAASSPSTKASPKPGPCAGRKPCPTSGGKPSPRGKPRHCATGKAKTGAKPCTKTKPPAGTSSASSPRPHKSIRPSGIKPTPHKTPQKTPKAHPKAGGKTTTSRPRVSGPRAPESTRPPASQVSPRTTPRTTPHETPRVQSGAADGEHPSRPAGGQTNAGDPPAMPEAPGPSGSVPVCRGADCPDEGPVDVEAGVPDVPDPEAAEPPEPEAGVAVPPPPGSTVPPVPRPDANVLPQMSPPADPNVAAGRTRMTLMAPVGAEEGDDTDWAVVVGAALVAEIGLLWGAACIALWRRRIRLSRATSGSADDGPV
ncbi:hypothetical protein LUW74_38290 [Actinomadura madurae]|uniref:hypothetical protein n=1 Tax=Actinomadura madurae TaxID=1993 RepID=UPI002027288D|nr:hypothetical protein [Actinomadura madurae]URN08641.1 hypothetical protein LUW74_38290 [Actinomadura madurae]